MTTQRYSTMRIEDIDRRHEKRIKRLCHEIDTVKKSIVSMETALAKVVRKRSNAKRDERVKQLETDIANHRKTVTSLEKDLKGVCK